MVITLWSTGGNDGKAKNGCVRTGCYCTALPVRNCRCFHLIFIAGKKDRRDYSEVLWLKKLTVHFQKLYPAEDHELAMEQCKNKVQCSLS